MASSLLIDDNPLQVLPKLAEKIGLNEAIILQQLHYWLNRSDNRRDGEKWVYNSYTGWKEQFPFWGIRTIQRAFLNLENLGLIKVNNYNKMKGDLTKWYTIDYAGVTALETSTLLREKLTATSDTPSCQNGTMPSRQNGTTITPDWHDHDAKMTRPIPETTTEITSKNTTTPNPKEQPHYKKPLGVELNKEKDDKAQMRTRLLSLLPSNQRGTISSATNSKLHELTNKYPLDWISSAFDISSTANALNKLSYLISVLDHWGRHKFNCSCGNPKAAEPTPLRPRSNGYTPYEPTWGAPTAPGGPSPMNTFEGIIGDDLGVYGKDYVFVPVGA